MDDERVKGSLGEGMEVEMVDGGHDAAGSGTKDSASYVSKKQDKSEDSQEIMIVDSQEGSDSKDEPLEYGIKQDSTGNGACDCLIMKCPGCHFPCNDCGSRKCGQVCRIGRNWDYEEIRVQGAGDALTRKRGAQ